MLQTSVQFAEQRINIARRHVENGRTVIDQQRALIAEKKARGLNTNVSEQLLATFERTQAIFEDDLATFIKKAQPGK